jgi:DNA-binding cell septation regulator SpoVG
MKITKIKIRKLDNPKQSFSNPKYYIVAYASVTFDDMFMVHGIKILEKETMKTSTKEYKIEMQKQKLKDNSLKDMYHAVDNEFREYMQGVILGHWNNG